MGIFSSIVNAIFGSKAAAAESPAASGSSGSAAAPGSAPAGSSAPTPISKGEVEAIIAKIEADRGLKYNWRQSIVDLMKLLDLDSSLAARKELAQELGYKGALDGSAEMNVWLHKQVMDKLAEGGGKVPDSLK
jgi:hypothetical protein